MASLHDVQAAIFPTARPLVEPGSTDLAAEVAWVRVMKPRVPAFDALEPGDLAIIPGSSLAIVAPEGETTGAVRELIGAFIGAHVPAILLVDNGDPDHLLDTLGRAAVEAGLITFRLARADPVQVERGVIGYLVNRRAQLDQRAGELERELARLALLGRGLDVLAAAIGGFFGRPVVIEGRRGDPLVIHAPTDVPDAAGAVGRYLARPAAVALRVAIPGAPGESGPGGRLVLLGEEPARELERVASDRLVALLALELARDSAVRHARDEVRRGDPLPAAGPPWTVILARQFPAESGDEIAAREEVRGELRLLFSPGRLGLRGTSESLELRMVAAASADDPECREIGDRLCRFLHRTVAISRPFSEAGGRPAAEASARATLDAVEHLAEAPLVALAARLPAYLLLGNLHHLPDAPQQAAALLAPILVGRPEVRRRRLDTLRAVLESPGPNEAAARLGVHRNTISYRSGRIERLAGWDLREPDLRLALLLAVRIVQREQS